MLVVVATVTSLVQGLTLAVASHASRALASAASGTGGEFVSAGGRILDTRAASSIGGFSTPMPAGTWRSVVVDGASLGGGNSLPSSDISAVAVSFMVVNESVNGTVHADKDEATPNAIVSYVAYVGTGGAQSDSGVVAVGSDGKIQVQTTSSTDLLIDVEGYYTADDDVAPGGYVPVAPTRIVDTRNGTGLPHAMLAAGSTSTIQVTGHGNVPAGASGVMLTILALDETAAGYVDPYPADQARPDTSMRYGTVSTAHGVEVGLSTTGTPLGAIKVYNSGASIDLTVDVEGYFTAGTSAGSFTPAAARVWDTRLSGNTPLAGGETRTVQIGGIKGVPLAGAGISAVTMNISVDDTSANASYVRAWSDGTSEPATVFSVRYHAASWTSEMSTTQLGADGAVKIHNQGTDTIDVVFDVEGWYSNATSPIPSGQDQTQQTVGLQGAAVGVGSWVTYQYRVGTVATFTNVPVGNVNDSSGNSPSAWPVTTSSGAFTAYNWNIRDTLITALGSASDTLIQVDACYGTSSTDTNLVCGMPSNVQFSQTAFGDGSATDSVGPGTVALLSGDYEIDATAAASLDGLSVGRSLTTLEPVDAGVAPGSQRTDATGVFGPGWTASLASPDLGDARLTVIDGSASGYLQFTAPDGSLETYDASGTTGTSTSYIGAGAAATNGKIITMTGSATITMIDADTTTTWTKSGTTWHVSAVQEGAAGSTSYSAYVSTGTGACVTSISAYVGLPCRILAAPPAGLTCSSPDTTPGCRSLILNYETVTIGTTPVTRLQSVQTSLPQTTGTANTITVADYDYTTGLLADAYDPRITPNLKTAYTYNSAGRLATEIPPGQAAWTLAYDSAGRVSTVSRPDPSGSTATDTIVYGVPTSGASAPIDMSAAQTGTWDETSDLPVTGTAVFNADRQPAGTTASAVSSSDWPYASIHYLDVNGTEVNTAHYGAGAWQIDTNQYDTNGNDVWDLSAGNRAQALTPTSSTDPYVAGLSSNLARAALLASTTVYNPLDPSEVTDTYGPTHPVTLDSGTTIDAQDHTATTYDQGAPNTDIDPTTGASYDLPTTVVTDPYNVATNADTGYPDAHTTTSGYGAINAGDTTGWTLYQPTTTTVQMDAAPSATDDLVTTTRYDTFGRIIETRLPGGATGGTAQSTATTYFTATGSGGCVSAASAGMLCSTAPATQPSGNPLPVLTYSYDQYGGQLTKTEAFGSSAVRTTSNTYDGAERVTTQAIAVSPSSAGGTPVPTVTYGYASTTGSQTTTSTGIGASLLTLTTGFNNIGEPTTYTDATGNVSSMTYDLDARLTSVNDGQGTTSYTYDSGAEHRGLVTSEDIGVSGDPSVFAASYDAAGNLATETYPNGLVATTSYDNMSEPIQLVYAKSGSTWMRFTSTRGDEDAIVAQTSATASPQSSQTFALDQDGRLTAVQDTNSGACTTRAYSFDQDSNRTSLKTYPATSGGSCSTSTTPTTANTTFDKADRDTNSGYAYDTLERTTTVPSADANGIAGYSGLTGNLTLGYTANDMVSTETQSSTSIAFTLDPMQNRILSQSDGTVTRTNHYSGTDDSPTWISTSGTAWTRNVVGPSGQLAATADQAGTVTLQLPNLHGDIAATAVDSTGATSIANYSETTEYGVPRSASSAFATYGSLGGDQRSSNDLGGLTLMGVRLYDPPTGRFLSADPVPGGNANAYVYPADPINSFDLNGEFHWVGPHFTLHMNKGLANRVGHDLVNGATIGSAVAAVLEVIPSVWTRVIGAITALGSAYSKGIGESILSHEKHAKYGVILELGVGFAHWWAPFPHPHYDVQNWNF